MKLIIILGTILLTSSVFASPSPLNTSGLTLECSYGEDKAFIQAEDTVYLENGKVTYFDNDQNNILTGLGSSTFGMAFYSGEIISFQFVQTRPGKKYAVARQSGYKTTVWMECAEESTL